MAIVQDNSKGSLVLVILFHLFFNFSLGFIDIIESHQSGEFVIKSLYLYVPITALFTFGYAFMNGG